MVTRERLVSFSAAAGSIQTRNSDGSFKTLVFSLAANNTFSKTGHHPDRQLLANRAVSIQMLQMKLAPSGERMHNNNVLQMC